MKTITIFGVRHTLATVDETLNALKALPIDKDTIVFVEPKKSILNGTQKCDDPNIMRFFKNILRYILSRGAEIMPLNPEFTPSHHNPILYRKIAQQFAEEEYMVDIIASTETDKKKLVIIGDIHAPRMRDLLEAKGLKVMYRSISSKTPSDIVLDSWREALLGHARQFISMRWLNKFRTDLRKRMMLAEDAKVPMIFYGNEKLYHQYLKEAHGMEVRGEEDKAKYLVECDKKFINDTAQLKQQTLEYLKKTGRKEDHAAVKENKIR